MTFAATKQKLFLVNVTATGFAVVPVMAGTQDEAVILAGQANALDLDTATNYFSVDSVDDGTDTESPEADFDAMKPAEQWDELRRLDYLCMLYNFKARGAKGLAEKLDWHKQAREAQEKRSGYMRRLRHY